MRRCRAAAVPSRRLPCRHRRRRCARPRDRPWRAPTLELTVRWQVRLVDAVAEIVVLPTVIDASDAVLLVAAKEQRCAAVRTAMIRDANANLCVAEGDELFAEEEKTHRYAVGRELRRFQCREPIMPQHIPHRRTRSDAGSGSGGRDQLSEP